MTNPSAETILKALYGDATKQLTDLVMAAEKAFNDFGKTSIFGKDKGQEAERRFVAASTLAMVALHRAHAISNLNDTQESLAALHTAVSRVREAYPNWPRAYKYLDDVWAKAQISSPTPREKGQCGFPALQRKHEQEQLLGRKELNSED